MDLKNTQSLQRIFKESNVEFAGVFGSYARGAGASANDIDILVRFRKPVSFSKFIRLQKNLHETLRIPVDLVTEKSLGKHIKNKVLQDLQTIYGKR